MIIARPLSEALADIREQKDIEHQVSRFARSLGFDTYTLGYVNPAVSEQPFFLDNHPDVDFGIPDVAARDPILARLKGEPTPFQWGQKDYATGGNMDIYEAGARAGIAAGIVAPVRPGGTRRMLISFDRNQPLDGTPAQLAQHLTVLDQFSRLMAGTVMSLFDTFVQLELSLTAIEKEVLRWTFAGLGAHDIAYRLRPHRGYGFVLAMLDSASKKVGANDPVAASIIAARAGVLGSI
ncbi:hypothetical protein FNU76_10300 [Chitinimonas arctica]|uniref:Transcription factor LuxR-like autoinducer-binding domain-containing protein n=1 Tax=Chitinimonas arctica TaxID=2594795 RepID=A0A516SEZ5_9NEIS|nr:autoinducer binding domain-containing protein [Chitinimonas arctica]QDQ26724.1 hypothetical protein FNU76_10300 [Chitinimonas arctica]